MVKMSQMRPRWASPLRYPGGKAKMASFLVEVFAEAPSTMDVEVWFEPFAGGLGAGLTALLDHQVPELWMCEAHPGLRAMWEEIIDDARGFAHLVEATTPTLRVFDEARELVADPASASRRDLGMAAFVLNRCSRSGVVHPGAGPIGGRAQSGEHTVASRYNGPALAERIRRIGTVAQRMRLIGDDGIQAIAQLRDSGVEREVFVFVDPPYIGAGNRLYEAGMSESDHCGLAEALRRCPSPWVLTLDDHALAHHLYSWSSIGRFPIGYSMAGRRTATELLITREPGMVPKQLPVV